MRPLTLGVLTLVVGCAGSVVVSPSRDAAMSETLGDVGVPADESGNRSDATDVHGDVADATARDPRCPSPPCLRHTILRSHRNGMWLVFPDGRTLHWGGAQISRPGIHSDRFPTAGPQLSSDVLDVQGQSDHNCALLADGGRVVCWGDGGSGQLGNRTLDFSLQPVEVAGLRGVTSIAVASNSSWALRGTQVFYWGFGPGLGGTPMVSAPRASFLISGATAFANPPSSNTMGVLLLSGGAVAWGAYFRTDTGEGPFGSRLAPEPIAGIRGITSLSLSPRASCAIAEPGRTTWCWGDRYGLFDTLQEDPPRYQESPAPVLGVGELVEVAVNEFFACGVTPARGVLCWGSNDLGGIGIGSNDRGVLPPGALVALPPVREIAMGNRAVCALTMEDEVYCWGSAESSVLTVNENVPQRSPLRVYPRSAP